jgi:hypothetical protein
MASPRVMIALLEQTQLVQKVRPLTERDVSQRPALSAAKAQSSVRMDCALPRHPLNVPPTRTSRMATVFMVSQAALQARNMPMDAVKVASPHSAHRTLFGRVDAAPASLKSTASPALPSRMVNVCLLLSPNVEDLPSMGRPVSTANLSVRRVPISTENAALQSTSRNARKDSSSMVKSALPTRLPSVHLDPFSTRPPRTVSPPRDPSALPTSDSTGSIVPSSPESAWNSSIVLPNRMERGVVALLLEWCVTILRVRAIPKVKSTSLI